MALDDQDSGLVIVDDDDAFLDEAKRALDGRVPTVRYLTDAQRRIEEGGVSLVVLGPSFASESALGGGSILSEDDPDVGIVLVAASPDAPVIRDPRRVRASRRAITGASGLAATRTMPTSGSSSERIEASPTPIRRRTTVPALQAIRPPPRSAAGRR